LRLLGGWLLGGGPGGLAGGKRAVVWEVREDPELWSGQSGSVAMLMAVPAGRRATAR
jgi:hypothetical protein